MPYGAQVGCGSSGRLYTVRQHSRSRLEISSSSALLAITGDSGVVGKLVLRWGVYPFQINVTSSVEGLFATGANLCKELGLAKPGDLIVITGGIPVGMAGSTNLLKVERIQ